MGKQYKVTIVADATHCNNMYVGFKTLEMFRCHISYQYFLVRSNRGEYVFRTDYLPGLKSDECGFSSTH